VVRTRQPVLVAEPWLRGQIRSLAKECRADLVLLDPALPLGLLGPTLGRPYGLVLHGAEVTVPGRLPGSNLVLRHVLRGAELVVAAGGYPLAEAERAAGRALPSVVVPPGVDTTRFTPLGATHRKATRKKYGITPDAVVIAGVSRLVPRKGFDTLIDLVGDVGRSDVELVIVGGGRDRDRLERRAVGKPVRFLGRVPDADLPDVYGCADLFAMLCRDRWIGLEQEGFGIVFLEAAAAGIPSLAGRSGGSHEAVIDGVTGRVVAGRAEAARALAELVEDPSTRAEMGRAARRRATDEFDYDILAARLGAALTGVVR
jgi:phosphatidylinositol alpha-1,6-mannosyltransferase